MGSLEDTNRSAVLVSQALGCLLSELCRGAVQARSKLTTHSLHSELVFNLAGSKHIRESLTNFGISETTTCVLVARFNATPEDLAQLRDRVDGTEVPASELAQHLDSAAAQKAFRCSAHDMTTGSLVDHALCKVAIKDC